MLFKESVNNRGGKSSMGGSPSSHPNVFTELKTLV
jgi:hypothetical protein